MPHTVCADPKFSDGKLRCRLPVKQDSRAHFTILAVLLHSVKVAGDQVKFSASSFHSEAKALKCDSPPPVLTFGVGIVDSIDELQVSLV